MCVRFQRFKPCSFHPKHLRHSLSVEGNHLPSCQVANSNPNKEGGTKALVFLTFSEVFGIRTEQSASGIHPTKVHSPYGMRFVDLGWSWHLSDFNCFRKGMVAWAFWCPMGLRALAMSTKKRSFPRQGADFQYCFHLRLLETAELILLTHFDPWQWQHLTFTWRCYNHLAHFEWLEVLYTKLALNFFERLSADPSSQRHHSASSPMPKPHLAAFCLRSSLKLKTTISKWVHISRMWSLGHCPNAGHADFFFEKLRTGIHHPLHEPWVECHKCQVSVGTIDSPASPTTADGDPRDQIHFNDTNDALLCFLWCLFIGKFWLHSAPNLQSALTRNNFAERKSFTEPTLAESGIPAVISATLYRNLLSRKWGTNGRT